MIFDPIPLLLVASAWYLLFTSILMIGQYFLEKRFSRGVGQAAAREEGPRRKPARSRRISQRSAVDAQGSEHTK